MSRTRMARMSVYFPLTCVIWLTGSAALARDAHSARAAVERAVPVSNWSIASPTAGTKDPIASPSGRAATRQARDAGQAAPMVRTAPTLATSVHDWHASPGTAAAGGASGPSYATSVGNWHASPGTAAATGASGPSYATSVHEWHPPAQAPAAQAPAAEPCAVEEPAPSPR
jgi:hypothetical protein